MLAIELGRRGVSVVLVDSKPGTTQNVQANATQARTMEYYRRLGFAEEIRALGMPADFPTDIAYFTRFATHELARFALPSAREALAPYVRGARTTERASVARIIGEVCRHYRVTQAELTSARRTARVAVPRQVAMFLCRRHTDAPLQAIGAELGGRDHSTVVHALGAVERRLAADHALRDAVAALDPGEALPLDLLLGLLDAVHALGDLEGDQAHEEDRQGEVTGGLHDGGLSIDRR